MPSIGLDFAGLLNTALDFGVDIGGAYLQTDMQKRLMNQQAEAQKKLIQARSAEQQKLAIVNAQAMQLAQDQNQSVFSNPLVYAGGAAVVVAALFMLTRR